MEQEGAEAQRRRGAEAQRRREDNGSDSTTDLERYCWFIYIDDCSAPSRPPVKFVFPVSRFYYFLWCSLAPAKWICVLWITRCAQGPQAVRVNEEFQRPVCTGAVRLGYKYFR